MAGTVCPQADMFNFWNRKNKKAPAARRAAADRPQSSMAEDVAGKAGKFEIVASVQTDVGCHRELNEDCGRIVQPGDSELLSAKGRLVIVADGMGGHSAGEVASSMAVDIINRSYYDDPGDAPSALKNAFFEANRQIHESSLQDKARDGMGTTCTALAIHGRVAHSAHVGDSRLYLVRSSSIYQMTEDHSVIKELIKQGAITPSAARHYIDRNIILRALGSHAAVQVATWEQPLPVRPGDRFVLCSDGLHESVSDEEILLATHSGETSVACESLITTARDRGAEDNITVAIARVEG